jgi:phosphate starvation-inducible PhoH-like protein
MRMTTVRCFANSKLWPSGAKGKKFVVEPRTPTQRLYVEGLLSKDVDIVVASGVAGSGKTMLATSTGIQMLKEGRVNKLILTRPAVSTEESHGFLPGTLDQKMEPWTRPLFDVIESQFRHEDVKKMIANKTIEICPIAFMRGRTFEKSWIICDEAQNCTPNQMLMIMTRMGTDSKLIITGDPTQHDRGYENNGITDLVDRLMSCPIPEVRILIVEMTESDVQRHPLIPYIIRLYS